MTTEQRKIQRLEGRVQKLEKLLSGVIRKEGKRVTVRATEVQITDIFRRPRIILQAMSNNFSGIWFRKASGKVYAGHIGCDERDGVDFSLSSIRITDPQNGSDKMRIGYSCYWEKPGIELFNKEGKVVARLFVKETGESRLAVHDYCTFVKEPAVKTA